MPLSSSSRLALARPKSPCPGLSDVTKKQEYQLFPVLSIQYIRNIFPGPTGGAGQISVGMGWKKWICAKGSARGGPVLRRPGTSDNGGYVATCSIVAMIPIIRTWSSRTYNVLVNPNNPLVRSHRRLRSGVPAARAGISAHVQGGVAVEEVVGHEAEAGSAHRHYRPLLGASGMRQAHRVPQHNVGVDQRLVVVGVARQAVASGALVGGRKRDGQEAGRVRYC